jgi:hypothetical protein
MPIDKEQRVKRHLFHVQRLLQRAWKRAKTLHCRRLIRRIKQAAPDPSESNERSERRRKKEGTWEEKLRAVKACKVPEAAPLMHKFAGMWDDDLKARCASHLPPSSNDQMSNDQISNDRIPNDKISDPAILAVINDKSFQKELRLQVERLRTFLTGCLAGGGSASRHRAQSVDSRPAPAKRAEGGDTKRSFNMRSFFMSSLSNASEDVVMGRRPKAAFQANPASSVSGRTEEVHRNRPGQRARRAMRQQGEESVLVKPSDWRSKREPPKQEQQPQLHPSWQAARTQRSKLARAIAVVPRQHIKFDDD